MDEGESSETLPDLRDLEVKIGRKTPEGLLRWMREEGSCRAPAAQEPSDTGQRSLDEKIRKLKLDMAHLRSVDVKILQQLLAVHEGIEAVKWLVEERSTLTSRCSSLTSSQYSLGEGPDTSWRGSWSSLHDPNDKLDNISVGSYLDTLADEMDEYCPSTSESVVCSTAPLASEGGGRGGRTGEGTRTGTEGGTRAGNMGAGASGGGSGTGAATAVAQARANGDAVGAGTATPKEVKPGPMVEDGTSIGGAGGMSGSQVSGTGKKQIKAEGTKEEAPIWTKAKEMDQRNPITHKDNAQMKAMKTNGILEKSTNQTSGPDSPTKSCPKFKSYKNRKIGRETCKNGMNGKMHLEYDAHWRWVQSQEDVTFL